VRPGSTPTTAATPGAGVDAARRPERAAAREV
jgi:hypothetical protein